MAIAKNPKRNLIVEQDQDQDREAQAFISGAGQEVVERENKKPIMIRVDSEMLSRIDRGAKRLGLSRSAFVVSSAAEKLERME